MTIIVDLDYVSTINVSTITNPGFLILLIFETSLLLKGLFTLLPIKLCPYQGGFKLRSLSIFDPEMEHLQNTNIGKH